MYHTFPDNDIEFRNLEFYVKLLFSPKEKKTIKTCHQEKSTMIVKGTYLIKNIEKCEFEIKDQIIRNYQSTIHSKAKLIEYNAQHDQIINISELNLYKISSEIEKQNRLIDSIVCFR